MCLRRCLIPLVILLTAGCASATTASQSSSGGVTLSGDRSGGLSNVQAHCDSGLNTVQVTGVLGKHGYRVVAQPGSGPTGVVSAFEIASARPDPSLPLFATWTGSAKGWHATSGGASFDIGLLPAGGNAHSTLHLSGSVTCSTAGDSQSSDQNST